MKKIWKAIGWVMLTVCIIVLCIVVIRKIKNSYEKEKFINAIESGQVEEVKKILESGRDPNYIYPKPSKWWAFLEYSPERPLCVACDEGNLEMVELLIEYGATAEPREHCGFTPLRETLFYYKPKDVQIVKILLDNGAREYNEEYDECIAAAAQMIPKVFDKNKTNGTVFWGGYDEETAKSITEIVIILLEDRSVNALYDGRPLLTWAARSGNIYLVKYLLSSGANQDVKDVLGKKALDYAKEEGHKEVIDVLSQYPKEVE